MMQERYDIVVVGGGIIGLATTSMLINRYPRLRIGVLEKEAALATHQTGHNSGVIHAGIYYRPDSLKARLCVEGGRRMVEFCHEHGIQYERCGKVVVATNERELRGLAELERRSTANGVSGVRRIDSSELREIEPHVHGIAALHSPNTAIVDYREVARVMADGLREGGVDIYTGQRVARVVHDGQDLRLVTEGNEITASYLINCAGLYSDTIARMMGVSTPVQIIPFRGEYYFLRPDRQSLVRTLIYPVPDPDLPFLGVHFTRTIHGQVEAGPNAVLSFAREGYTRSAIHTRELRETLTYPGFWKMARRYWRTGIEEFGRSLSAYAFARSLQRLVPAIESSDLLPGGAGVRAQAVAADGSLVDDFVIVESVRAIHVLNAPSPGATASLAIGDYIAGVAARTFALQ